MFQQLDDATIYYEEYGSGDRHILCAVQVFDPHRMGWPYDLAEEGFHVYVLQMRGYGRSSHVEQDLGPRWYDIWADDVAQFAQRQGIDRFLYTGASDGGGVGWHLCVRWPQILIGFVGLAAGPHSRSVGAVSPSRTYAIDSANSHAAHQELAEYTRQTILYFARKFQDDPVKKALFEEKAESYYQQKLDMTPEELRIQPGIPLSWLTTDQQVMEQLSRIDLPVLLVNGLQDAMLPIEKAILPMRVIQGAKAIFYQEATNRLYYSRPEDLRREICIFADDAFCRDAGQR